MNSNAPWFDDVTVIGRMTAEQVAEKLRELGDEQAMNLSLDALRGSGRAEVMSSRWWPFGSKAYMHTAHAFGYLAPEAPGTAALAIQHVGNIAADTSLRNSRLKIVLNGLRVADYPGRGSHRILFDFYAQNQVPRAIEHLHFNLTYRVREGERAAVIGYPIFIGLNVGTEGLALKCFTVNVSNDDDEALLGALESDVFKSGLKLITAAQPAIAPLSGIAMALTKSIAAHNRNVPVQDFYLGLDFTSITGGARLAEGTYIAVQIPEAMTTIWSWQDWVYRPETGQIVSRDNPTELIPYNSIMFGVSRYEE
jgi:hypothetical protein